MLTNEKCMCGKGISYQSCCAPYHQKSSSAPTAELLMRSRYSAFVLKKVDYLIETHHKSTIHTVDIKDLFAFCNAVHFQKLEITKVKKGKEHDRVGTVKFKAYYLENGVSSVIEEASLFEKIDGIWYYKSGIHSFSGK